MDLDTGIFVFEILGVIAFAFSGAILAIRKCMDLLGVIVLAVTTAVGGTSAKKNNNSNETTAIAITKADGKNKVASYVILVSDKFSGSSDDVVFVKEVSKDKISYKDKDGEYQTGYNVELYYLDRECNRGGQHCSRYWFLYLGQQR